MRAAKLPYRIFAPRDAGIVLDQPGPIQELAAIENAKVRGRRNRARRRDEFSPLGDSGPRTGAPAPDREAAPRRGVLLLPAAHHAL